jgi:hypothetical protein
MALKPETLFERFEEAIDEHERVSCWLRESPRGSHERRVWRNRQWEIRRRMNKYAKRIKDEGLFV